MRSSSGSSAQWMSSKHEHERLRRRRARRPRRAPPRRSPVAARSPRHGVEHPDASPSRSATASLAQHSRSFSIASSSGVVVGDARRPPCTISASGQYVTPSPYGSARPGEHRRALEPVDELARETALPDPRLAEDRDEMRAPVAHGARERVLEQVELLVAPDERRARRRAGRAGLRASAQTTRQAATRPGEPLAARARRPASTTTAPAVEPVRRRTDQDLARRGGLLQPRGDVHGLAGREGRVAVLDDDLARLDADAHLEAELLDRVEDRERGADRPLARRPRAPTGRRRPPSRHRRRTSRRCRRARRCTARPLEEARHAAADDLRIGVLRRARVESTRSTNSTVASFRSTPDQV